MDKNEGSQEGKGDNPGISWSTVVIAMLRDAAEHEKEHRADLQKLDLHLAGLEEAYDTYQEVLNVLGQSIETMRALHDELSEYSPMNRTLRALSVFNNVMDDTEAEEAEET